MSSRRLRGRASKQDLSFVEKRCEDSKEIRTEIDGIKEPISNAHNPATVTEERFTNTVAEINAKINSLEVAVSSLLCKSCNSGILDTAGPSTTSARSYSTTGIDKAKTKKRKICVADTEAGPSEVLKVEPPKTDDFPKFKVDQNGYVHVYTDGACKNNGKVGAKAGIGVWFADNHPLNRSERVHGRQTNNTAEIQAATCAIQLAKTAGIKKLLIHTDSEFLINCSVWIDKWKDSDWKLSTGGRVKNKEDLMELDEAMEGIFVKWEHVRAHTGNHGNEMADELSKAAVMKRN